MNGVRQSEASRSTRESLLSRLRKEGDDESWSVFFESYWALIYGTARHAGLCEPEAEDVVQETVIKLMRDLRQFKYDRQRGSFKSWLLQRVWWEIKMHLRKERRRQRLLLTPLEITDHAEEIPDASLAAIEQYWEEQWRKEVYANALEQVRKKASPRTFQLFDMVICGGMRPGEVARRMGVSTMQVYLAKHRIGKMLKSEVQLLEEGPCN
jgi:RNA polymerase sigma factor (sigma-70 family)